MEATREVTLTANDPTVFAVCPRCNARGKGVLLGDINCKAFTRREWRMNPECENCHRQMVFIYEYIGA
jgi:hypothetical protein